MQIQKCELSPRKNIKFGSYEILGERAAKSFGVASKHLEEIEDCLMLADSEYADYALSYFYENGCLRTMIQRRDTKQAIDILNYKRFQFGAIVKAIRDLSKNDSDKNKWIRTWKS